MPNTSPQQVTRLLQAWGQGEDSALEKLVPLVRREPRRVARRYMFREHAAHTLQATALVNEAYLKLLGCQKTAWQNQAHFLPSAKALIGPQEKGHNLVALYDALKAFAEIDFCKSRVVELRFFGGLGTEETPASNEGFSLYRPARLEDGQGLAEARKRTGRFGGKGKKGT